MSGQSTCQVPAQGGLRERKKAGQIARILEVSRTLFRERGINNAELIDIARQADVSRTTLYRYFDGKDAIVRALFQEDWDKQAAMFEHLVEQPDIDKAAIARWLHRLIRAMGARVTSLPLFQSYGPESSAVVRAQRDRLVAILSRRFRPVAEDQTGAESRARKKIELLLIIFQIEQFSFHAATHPQLEETEVGVDILSNHLLALLSDARA